MDTYTLSWDKREGEQKRSAQGRWVVSWYDDREMGIVLRDALVAAGRTNVTLEVQETSMRTIN